MVEGEGGGPICARARSSSMATASGRHSSLGLIHTPVGDALLSGESFKYLHVSEVFVEQPKYASQSGNGTSDQIHPRRGLTLLFQLNSLRSGCR